MRHQHSRGDDVHNVMRFFAAMALNYSYSSARSAVIRVPSFLGFAH